VVCARLPEIDAMLDRLRREGASLALLSGSGAGVFGVFPDEAGADRASAQLRTMPEVEWTARVMSLATIPRVEPVDLAR